MPNTRESRASTMTQPVRRLQDLSAGMTAMASPAYRLVNFTSIATHSWMATYELWSELFENQKRFTARLVDAMGISMPARTRSPQPPAEPEFPIKRYDTLTVQEIASRLDRIRDARSVRTVMTYEARNKARKGVIAAGEARLLHLDS
jgi:hypothetical protein